MTVSNVLNGRQNVGAATRSRVLAVIDELGYEVNLTARRLRAGRTDTVALIVPGFAHPYFGELASAFATAFAQHGRHVVVAQSGASKEGELSALSQARLQLYDGVVLSPVGLSHHEIDGLRSTQPIVLLGDRPVPDRFDHVTIANVTGGRLATRFLLESGARRVAIAGGSLAPGDGSTDEPRDWTSALRTRGWLEAHAELGIAPDDALLLGDARYTAEDARAAIGRAVASGLRFDAVFAITDEMAYGVLAGLHDAGLRVSGDVSVVGFDNLAMSGSTVPGLTSVDPDREWIVRNAVSVLERRMAGDDGLPPQHLTTPVRLVERGSTRRRP